MSLSRSLQYLFLAIIVTTVGFSLYQWNASRASTQKTAPNNGLVGYWSFNEGTGTKAGDASGNGNTGTLTGGPTWVSGKLGQAVNFDGVNDYVNLTSSPNFQDNLPYTVAGWVKTTSGGILIGTWNAGVSSGMYINIGATSQILMAEAGASGFRRENFATSVLDGRWHHIVVTYTGNSDISGYSFYFDSTSVTGTSPVNTSPGALPNSYANIGRYLDGGVGTYHFNGQIDEVRIYNRALSGTEVTNLYNLGAEKLNVSPVSNLTSGLVGYWTFDGKDTPWSSSSAGTATDRSGNSNTGTLTNMSQSTSPTIGKLGQALNFDGTDDYTTSPDNATLDVTDSTNFSLSGWFSRNTFTTDDTIIAKSNGQASSDTGYNAYIDDTTDKLTIVANDGTDQYKIESVSTFTATGWHHFTLSWDDTSSANTKLYIDGVSESATTTGTFANVNSIANALTFRIGAESDNGNPFDGKIDEVRMYNRALSAGEIQSLYDLGASDKVNSSVSQNQGTGRLDSGLVGYWKLDDASGTTATDSSVNANNGTLTNSPTWGTGRIGGSVDFTGTKYITIPNSTPLRVTGDMTVSFWMYLRGYGPGGWNPIICKFSTDISNEFNIRYQTSSTGQFYSGGSGAINTFLTWDPSADAGLNNWVHVVARRNITAGTMDMWFNGIKKRSGGASGLTDATTQPLQFGGGPNGGAGGVDFNGLLDEVRIYNRAISDEEIAQLYRLTTPTGVDTSLKGYWSFNGSDISGTTAYDRSGSANNGTLTNGPTKTIGKLGQALNFDGVNDAVSAPIDLSGTSVVSVSFWLKWTAFANDDKLALEYTNNFGGKNGFLVDPDDSTAPTAGMFSFGTSRPYLTTFWTDAFTRPSAGAWHHYVLIMNRATPANTAYVDGVLQSLTAQVHTAFAMGNFDSSSLYFMSRGTTSLFGNGSLDEVRIYNRALSSTEVSALYNAGR